MMDDIIMPAKVRIFIFENMKAVRAGGNYLFNIISIQNLDVAGSHHLEKELVTGSSGRIAIARFFRAKNREIDFEMVQDFDKRPGNFLRALVKRTGTSYPE